jgi:hypothetical protein
MINLEGVLEKARPAGRWKAWHNAHPEQAPAETWNPQSAVNCLQSEGKMK